MIIFVLIFIFFFIKTARKTQGSCFLSPLFWLAFSWFGLFGIYFFSGIHYNNPLKISGFIYLLSQLGAFALCYKFAEFKIMKGGKYFLLTQGADLKTIPIKMYFYISLGALCVWIIDVFSRNNIILGRRIENFSISVIGVIADLCITLSLLVWIFSIYKSIKYNEKIPFYAYVSAVIYLAPSVVTSGRQPVMILLITTFICMAYAKINKYKYFSRFVKLGCVFLGVIILYLFFISITRDIGSDINDKIALTELTSNCVVTEDAVDFLNLFGPLKSVVLDFEVYYSHQLSGFQIFFENWDGPLYFGSVEFTYISRRFPSEWGFNKDAAYQYLEVIAKATDTYAHIWRTTFGEYIMDFGYLGAYIMFGAMGYMSGKRKKTHKYFDNIYNFAVLILLCVYAFFSIQASAWAETTWAYPYFWIFVIGVINLKKRRRR